MTNTLQIRRGVTAKRIAHTPADGELILDLTSKQLFVGDGVSAGGAPIEASDSTKAPLASPALTGVPTAPTATVATNTTQLATTAFVQAVNAADTGSSATALALKTARTFTYTGDVTGNLSFNGSANVSAGMTLTNSGAVAGTYKAVTVDVKGRVTAGVALTTGLVTSTTSAGTTNLATTNTNTYLNVVETVGTTPTAAGTSTQITGAGSVTVASDAVGKLTITGAQSITGQAATATKLATPRALNGINFDGSAAITIPVSVGNIAASSDLNTFQTAGFYSCPATTTAASLLNCPTAVAFSLLVEKHAGIKQTITEYTTTGAKTYSRNFYSTWGAWYRVYTTIDPPTAVTGNAGTATKLATPRAINGIPFDGSADITLNLPMLGIGQSWADVSASRALAVTYANSSNKPIEVMVTASATQNASLEITIGGVNVGNSSQSYYAGARVATTFIVPPNTTYKVAVVGGVANSFKWSELS